MSEEKTGEDLVQERLNNVEQAVLRLNEKINIQEKRIDAIEAGSPASFYGKMPETQASQVPIPKPPAYVGGSVMKEKLVQKMKTEETLEENIGGKWFARIGIAAVILGITIFLKYAFDNDWIGEAGRVAIGIISGIALLGVGEKTIRRYSIWGQIVSGGGIAILYLSIFSAFGFYDLISDFTAFFFMIVITAIGVALSLRYDALSLTIVSTVGGFLTPLMLGFEYQSTLFSYYALLDLAILSISVFKRWHSLNAVGFAFTVLTFMVWAAENYNEKLLFPTFMFMTLFFGIYSISSVIYNVVKKEVSTGVEQILSLLTAFIYFFGSYALLSDDYEFILGFFALILAIYYYLFAYSTRTFTPQDRNLYNFLALLAIGFITLAIPLQFDQNIITISWLVEGLLLLVLGLKINKKSVVILSVVVFALSVFRFFTFDSSLNILGNTPIFNKFFFTALMVVMAMYLSSYIVRMIFEENDEFKGFAKKSFIGIFLIVANFITIYSISHEIVSHYNNRIRELSSKRIERYNAPPSYGNYNGNTGVGRYDKEYYEQKDSLENRSSISLSIFWLIYSMILIAFGIMMKSKGARVGGLLLLILSIFKLFFYDLWSLGTAYKIVSSISLGLVLLLLSFVYQKYKNKIKEII